MIRLAALLAMLPLMAAAQEESEISQGRGAVLRGLDKMTGALTDMDIPSGGGAAFGRIEVTVEDCRYPTGNPAGDAYAHVTIRAPGEEPVFSGWMIASSPALNALDHPRYDIWVLRCMTS